MKLKLDLRKNLHANAAMHYESAKKMRSKASGALKAAEQTRKKIASLKPIEAVKVRVKQDAQPKEWFEKFRFFFTANGFLALAGKEAKQNDFLYSKHLQAGDLFFHADIQGAPAVVLKDGEKAQENDLLETAQFAASFSSAWKRGLHNVDVYAVSEKGVDKHVSGEFLAKGAFMIHGERKWFRNTPLRLKARVVQGKAQVVPALCEGLGVILMPGSIEKKRVVDKLGKELGAGDAFSQLLPQGSFDLA